MWTGQHRLRGHEDDMTLFIIPRAALTNVTFSRCSRRTVPLEGANVL